MRTNPAIQLVIKVSACYYQSAKYASPTTSAHPVPTITCTTLYDSPKRLSIIFGKLIKIPAHLGMTHERISVQYGCIRAFLEQQKGNPAFSYIALVAYFSIDDASINRTDDRKAILHWLRLIDIIIEPVQHIAIK